MEASETMGRNFMKPSKTSLLYGGVAFVLIAVLLVLLVRTRAVDFDRHNQILTSLRTLKQIDAQWDSDVLRAKTGLSNDYDKVASPVPLIAALRETLASQSSDFWHDSSESRSRLLALLDIYARHMDQKISLVERFKSQNAILRNSSRFLPVADTDFAEAMRAAAPSAETRAEIETVLNSLLSETMLYTLAADTSLRESIAERTRTLINMSQPLTAEARERADTLAAHVQTVLHQQDTGARLLAEISALPTARAIDDATDAQIEENEKLVRQQQTLRWALVAYSVFLLILLAYAATRAVRSYALLNASNAALQKANQDLKESQVHLVQAEKMSALGQMVAGIAHEINTPLAYVKGTFGLLSEQLTPVGDLANHSRDFARLVRTPDREPGVLRTQLRALESSVKDVVDGNLLEDMRNLLSDGVHGIEQISEIVLNLKNFSRLDRERVANFSVEAGLDSTLVLARHVLKNKVQIVKDYGGVRHIMGSPSQINQVLLNIITNAVQAMPADRTENIITLRTRMEEDGDMVSIEIQDNGAGIPADVLPKIFDPFFTTKPIGQGTGMGLSISYKIVQEHGGKLTVNSEQGIGTVFTIVLPVGAEETVAPVIQAEPEPAIA